MAFRKKESPKRLVIIPGFGDTPLSWSSVLFFLRSTLMREYDEVVVIDFPGFRGYLSRSRCIPTMDLLISMVHGVLDSLKPHTVLGHSLGGWLSSHYAVQCGKGERPSLKNPSYGGPQKLILVSPSGVCGSAEEWNQWKNLFERVTKGEMNFRSYLFAKEPFWFKWISPEFIGFMTREDIVQFVKSFREDHAVEKDLGSIESHVWLVWGEKDKLIPSRWASHWAERIQKRETILIPEVGHTPQIEKPLKFAKALGEILV